MNDLSLDIVIVNWNSGPLLGRCLASLPQACSDGMHIEAAVVVDNGSRDGSATFDAPQGLDVIAIRNHRNLGFAAACNLGARAVHAPYLLFLNPDTQLEARSLEGALRRLASDRAGRIGIVGLALVGDDGRRQRNTARFPTPARMLGQALGLDRLAPALVRPQFLTDWDHLDTREVDQVPGAAMLMRRSDFERLGGFDERFFLYMEDVDLALRAREAGLACIYIHDCVARHMGGGTTRRVRDKRLFYLLRSRVLYARKHFSPWGRAVAVGATMLCEPVARLVAAAVRLDGAEAKAVVKATAWLWR